jgi:hypothetical protein
MKDLNLDATMSHRVIEARSPTLIVNIAHD